MLRSFFSSLLATYLRKVFPISGPHSARGSPRPLALRFHEHGVGYGPAASESGRAGHNVWHGLSLHHFPRGPCHRQPDQGSPLGSLGFQSAVCEAECRQQPQLLGNLQRAHAAVTPKACVCVVALRVPAEDETPKPRWLRLDSRFRLLPVT